MVKTGFNSTNEIIGASAMRPPTSGEFACSPTAQRREPPASGQELLTLEGHSAPIRSVAFSPDALRIVTGSEDHTAKVWTAASKDQVAAWQKEERAAEGDQKKQKQNR